MQLTNMHGIPTAILEAIRNDDYNRGASDYTVTELIAPPRIIALRRKHKGEITEDAIDNIWALLGKAVHTILERADQDAITEERLYATVAGKKIGGQFDRLIAAGGILQDYKVTSTWSVIGDPKPEWVAQLNILRYLAQVNGVATIYGLQIVAILRDWSKNKARAGDYPPRQVAVVDIPVWSIEQTENYIAERVRLHEAARETLPECAPDERWDRPPVFAVMKECGKRALKLYEALPEAEAHAAEDKKLYVQTRPGVSVRCEDYCNVAQFCTQRRENANF